MVFQWSPKIENVLPDTPILIILAFNQFEIIHKGACVPTTGQASYLPDVVHYESGGMDTAVIL